MKKKEDLNSINSEQTEYSLEWFSFQIPLGTQKNRVNKNDLTNSYAQFLLQVIQIKDLTE